MRRNRYAEDQKSASLPGRPSPNALDYRSFPLPEWARDYLQTDCHRRFHACYQRHACSASKGAIDRAVAKCASVCEGVERFNPFRELAQSAHEISNRASRVPSSNGEPSPATLEGKRARTHSWAAIFEDVAQEHNDTL